MQSSSASEYVCSDNFLSPPWSPHQDDLLRDLWAKMPSKRYEIGKIMGRTPTAIGKRATKLGLKKRPHCNRDMAILRAGKIRHDNPDRPLHVMGEEFSAYWWESQNRAFIRAMHANPEDRPTDILNLPRGA